MSNHIAHHGVKGMKWGVRKETYSSDEIHAARDRQDARLRELNRHADAANTATDSKSRKDAESKARKAAVDYQTNEDRVIAEHMTSGEKAVALVVGGPLGLIKIASINSRVKKTINTVDDLRKHA